MMGVLIFNCIAMLEFAIVNFCTFNYQFKQKYVDEAIDSIKTNLKKFKKRMIKKILIKKMTDEHDELPTD